MNVNIDIDDVWGLQERLLRLEQQVRWTASVICKGHAGAIEALREELSEARPPLEVYARGFKIEVSITTPGKLAVKVLPPAARPERERAALLAHIQQAVRCSFVLQYATSFTVESVELG